MIHYFISNITDNILSDYRIYMSSNSNRQEYVKIFSIIIYNIIQIISYMIIQQMTKREKIIDPRWLCCKIMLYYHFIKFYTNVSLFLQQCASENIFIKLTKAWKNDS